MAGKREEMSGASSVVECPLCGYFSLNFTLHVSHLRLVHSSDRSFNIVCSIRGCAETFRAFAAYNSHVYRRHRNALGLETVQESDGVTGLETVQESDGVIASGSQVSVGERDTSSIINTTFNNDDHEHDITSVQETTPLQTVPMSESGPTSQITRAAKFLLYLREGRRVAQVALTDVIDFCNVMSTQAVNDVKQEVLVKCVQANVDICRIEYLEDVLSRKPLHPFKGVDTIYRLEKFCVDHFGW